MSKYIDQSMVNDEIVRVLEHTDCKDEYIDWVLMAIEKLPTFDLVTCDECRHRDTCMGVVEQWMFDGEEIIDSALLIRYCSGGEEEVEK